MKKITTILSAALLVAMLGMNVNANAQRNSDRKVHAEVHLMGGAPLGDFGKYSKLDNCVLLRKNNVQGKENTEGAASFIGGLGVKVTFAMPVNNLSLFVGIDALVGTVKGGLKDDIDKASAGATAVGVSHSWSYPDYIMAPLMGGARYEINITEGFGFYGEAGLGLNGFSTTGFTDKYKSGNKEITEDLKGQIDYSFCFQLGIGLNLGQRVRLGVSYYNLGTCQAKYKYTITGTTGSTTSFDYTDGEIIKCGKVSPSMIMANFGFIF